MIGFFAIICSFFNANIVLVLAWAFGTTGFQDKKRMNSKKHTFGCELKNHMFNFGKRFYTLRQIRFLTSWNLKNSVGIVLSKCLSNLMQSRTKIYRFLKNSLESFFGKIYSCSKMFKTSHFVELWRKLKGKNFFPILIDVLLQFQSFV